MVEVSKGQASESALRERLKKLTAELDEIEGRHGEVLEAFRAAVGALANLGVCQLSPGVEQALASLKNAASAQPVEAAHLEQAVAALREALLLEPPQQPGGGTAAGAAGAAGAHVALALLEGLRLGEPAFDTHLEKTIAQINRLISGGLVRPAMGLLVDLLDHYRSEQSRRWQRAEQALREVLREIVTTESEFADMFSQTQERLSSNGQTYEEQVTASMGRMVQEVSQANSLEALKLHTLEHIRGLRDFLKAHRSQEKELLSQTRGELDQLKASLSATRQRMEQVERLSEMLNQEAHTDPLTKAPNKRALSLHLEESLAAPPGGAVSLIVFDIDHFKTINDRFGHQAGDRALQAIATQAGQSLRAQDTLFRYAGDEFVILLLGSRLADAASVAERVRLAAESIRFTYQGTQEIRISVSLGVAEHRPGESAEQLFERADQALLQAKRAGRNRVASG